MNALKRKRKMKRLVRRFIRTSIIIIPILLLIGIAAFFIQGQQKDNEKDSQEVVLPSEKEESTPEPEPEPEPIRASILSAGDIIMHDPLLTSNYYKKADGSFDYNSLFRYIQADYKAADFTVLNLECTIADGNYKGYPNFRAPSAIVSAMANNHVNACMLANNHIYDNLEKGFRMTMDAVENNKLLYMGVRKTTNEKTYTIQEINGIKVGFFNYVYNTGAKDGQDVSINAIAVSNAVSPLINTFNYGNLQGLYNNIQAGLEEMKAAGVEYTIAYIHWGAEYQTTENSRQRQIAAKLCELGIDALIGGHPHVVQPVDLLTNSTGDHQMLCVYSLGNHLSNQYQERMDSCPSGHTEDGLMVNLILEKGKNGAVSLIQADFIPTWVYRTVGEPDEGNPEYFIMPLNHPEQLIKDAAALHIASDVQTSLNRTNTIIGNGVAKIQSALPIRAK